ncbi:trihelix transcription factor DF1-like [Nicotiana tomentosiformis]|uniref:trihelix transcription factor DF1-like n=1 Tax=Nicotiana tomentosiformis TaxID=4098 RepID=UPI00051C3205|nr:trihelix transcription factor GTL1-like [Nicotiana tomentosiformis]
MLGVSGIISSTNSGGDGAGGENPESGGGAASGGSSEIALGGGAISISGGFMTEEDRAIRNMEEGERNSGGGNRWPRQETIALLKIRSEMDVVFRDSSLKGPLWEEVSRKMADLGFHRSAKKCKEKFENVYKYHKRTKDGRASKADGKTYRFFEQLEALENNPSSHHSLLPPAMTSSRPPPPPLEATPINMAMPMPSGNANTINLQLPTSQQGTTTVTVSSAPPNNSNILVSCHQNTTSHQNIPLSSSMAPSSQPSPQPANNPINNLQANTNFPSHQNISAMSYSTSSSTSSDEDIQRRHKKKRKWKDFFERLMKDVIDKQEDLQRRFLETLEKRERDRTVREEAWRVQEVARMNREHDLLVQERSMAAAKDAAVISFLQKITEQQNIQIPSNINVAPPSAQVQIQLPKNPPPPPTRSQVLQQQTQSTILVSPAPPQQSPATPAPISLPVTIPAAVPAQSLPLTPPVPAKNVELTPKSDNGGEGYTPASSSRWPKAEVEALIKLRTQLDVKYQENGPKGPLWEEISAGMKKLGYNRNAKRCKEKWENINKYFKKVKESNKKRPEDSKTCPYFHQLDALYKEKAKNETSSSSFSNPSASGFALNPENNPMMPIMARPEQQWPLPPHHQQHHESTRMDHDHESDNMDQDEDEEDEEDEDEENAYEIVANKQQSSMAAANTATTTTATATTTV